MNEPEPINGYRINREMPLHQLFKKRMRKGRDLKIIITARNSSTGTGKTTLAAWLAMQWNPMFTGEQWSAEEAAALKASTYERKHQELNPGSVLLFDEAEDLDARRAMAGKNVDFSHLWMKMRVRQICSILTLPTMSALDKRLKELADVWINVVRRGKANVYSIRIMDGSADIRTPFEHQIEWPDISDHPEMQRLDEMKQTNIDETIEEEEAPDPETVRKQKEIETAERLLQMGLSQDKAGEAVGKSQSWVSRNCNPDANDSDSSNRKEASA